MGIESPSSQTGNPHSHGRHGMRRLWPEGCDVSEITRVTGHDCKTTRKYLQMDDFSPDILRLQLSP